MKRLFLVILSCCCICSIVFSYDLRLTEVFVDGADEFVEISNMSSDPFVGNLVLSGAKSSLLALNNISVPAWSSFVLGDNLAMISSFNGFQYKTGLSLNFIDTAPLSLSLWQGTTILDSFGIEASDVVASDNAKTSFHKYFGGNQPFITLSSPALSSSVIAGFTAHPGKVYDANGSVLIPYSTGASPGNSITIDCSTVLSGILHIDELHDGSQYADYIELVFDQDWVGGLILSGNALSVPFTLPSQSWVQGQRYLITNSFSGFHHNNNIALVSGRNLSTGLLTVSSLSNQSLVFALVDTGGQSVYHTSDYNCVAGFATLAAPSPGFDQVFLSYLNTNTITTTVTVTGSCATNGSTNGGGSGTTGGVSGTVNSLSSIAPGDIKISFIDYDPPGSDTNNERIGFLSLSGDVVLSGLSLSYDGKLYKLTTGIVVSGQEMIITGNYSFVNSRTVCVALYNQSVLIDTACYDPTQDASPLLPLQSSSTSGQNSTGVVSEDIDYASLQFDIRSLVYDPPGFDTNNESITIYFSGGISEVSLDNFRLRVGTSNKRVYGVISSGETKVLFGNFQMSNSNPTCVALSYNEIIYDEYCYNPIRYAADSPNSTVSNIVNTTSSIYSSRLISLIGVEYDPEGSDTDRETVTLLMTGNQEAVDLSKLYIRFGSTKRQLKGTLAGSGSIIITGNFQMPNSKSTCVDLIEGSHIFDTYCYDSMIEVIEDTKDLQETEGTGKIKEVKKKISEPVIDRLDYYSGLQLQRILPNPKDKDIKGTNEKFSLYWSGIEKEILNKQVKLVVGKTIINLSGVLLSGQETVIVSPKSLVNKSACARLFVANMEIDKICYPQTKEGQIYYNERIDSKSFAIPNSVIDELDKDGVDLSQLSLKKSGTQVCLVYDKIKIRCMAGGSNKTSITTKKLITLGNAYIGQMNKLIGSKSIEYTAIKSRTDSYHDLAVYIKQGRSTITIRGHIISTTDIDAYKVLVYERESNDIVADALVYSLFNTIL